MRRHVSSLLVCLMLFSQVQKLYCTASVGRMIQNNEFVKGIKGLSKHLFLQTEGTAKYLGYTVFGPRIGLGTFRIRNEFNSHSASKFGGEND
jgi:hypothetical protein